MVGSLLANKRPAQDPLTKWQREQEVDWPANINQRIANVELRRHRQMTAS